MQIHNYPFSEIYRRNETDNRITLLIMNKDKPWEALAFYRFSFYLININSKINLDGFVHLFSYGESDTKPISYIRAISSTDINDIVYIKFGDDSLIVLTHSFDNYSGDSYQMLRIITNNNNSPMTPLNVTEYEKFNKDFESEKPCDVLDLRFI